MASSSSSLRGLRRLAAATRRPAVVASAARAKATQAMTASHAQQLSSNAQEELDAMPFWVPLTGSALNRALSPSQLELFASKFLGAAASASCASTPSMAMAALRKERDDALTRARTMEASLASFSHRASDAESKLSLAKHALASELATLRADKEAAELTAADYRIALNALREESRSRSTTDRDRADADADAAAVDARLTEVTDALDRAEARTTAATARALDAEHALACALEDAAKAKAKAKSGAAHHATYGALLHDFGYKRVYATPVTSLTSKERVAVYDQQRAFRAERAETIAEEKAKEAAELSGGFCIPGVISIAEGTANVKGGGARKKKGSKGSKDSSGDVVSASILDGQHRVGALDILLARGVLKPTDAILTEVFPNVDDVRAAALFTEINAATPIRFMDLPGVVEPDAKWALEGAAAKLRDAYPSMFSPSVRCKIPNVNIDALREELHGAEVGSRLGLTTEDDLVGWMLKVNAELAERSEKQWLRLRPKRGRAARGSKETYLKALAKAREHGFFLGMCDSWLDGPED